MIEIKFKKLHDDAKVPLKSTDGSAGFDIFALEDGEILPNKISMVKTGFATAIPKEYFFYIRPRSGLAAKKGINTSTSGVIDSDYRGEYLVPLINLGTDAFQYKKHDRIAQMVLLPVPQVSFVEVEDLDGTSRGIGGYGSTGQ